MTPASYNFFIKQGATFSKKFIIYQTDGSPYDLTDYTARMDIREKISSSEPIISLTTENGKISITSPTEGIFYLLLTATETASLTTNGFYDIELISGSTVLCPLKGEVKLILEVTR
jgi:hypothetical protein